MIFRFLQIVTIVCAVLFMIYPFFHEVGHILMATLFGVKIETVVFYPAHFVELSGSMSLLQAICISFGSSAFPFICMVFPVRKSACAYYFKLSVLLLWLFCSIESLVKVMLYYAGNKKCRDDAVVILQSNHQAGWLVLVILLFQIMVGLAVILKMRPLKATIEFLEKEMKARSADLRE